MLRDVVAEGDRLKSLAAIRDHLAATLDDPLCPPQSVAALTKQLAEVMRELASIAPPEQESTVDEIASQRRKRRQATAVSKRRSAKKHSG